MTRGACQRGLACAWGDVHGVVAKGEREQSMPNNVSQRDNRANVFPPKGSQPTFQVYFVVMRHLQQVLAQGRAHGVRLVLLVNESQADGFF